MPTLLTHGVKTLSIAALLSAAALAPATAQTVYGLQLALPSTFSLVTFQATAPGTFTATVPITGLGSGQALVGLDTRPTTG
ncbi:MAG: hypothetical protein ACRYFK_10465 [Janthinobacterium lividum]